MQQTEVFQLALPIFEGPLDLLLHLIEREELDVTNIALLAVTDQYMQYLHSGEHINLAAMADFIQIGAKLLLLKSRALLPRPAPGDPPVVEEEDPSEDLARQLIEYKLFKEAAGQLRAIETAGPALVSAHRAAAGAAGADRTRRHHARPAAGDGRDGAHPRAR